MNDLRKLSLDNICRGHTPILFAHELKKVLENMADPNTDPEATRKITLEFTFKPLKSRNEAAVALESKTKLAGPEAVGGHIFVRHAKNGPLATTHDVTQGDAFDTADETVDRETGEVIERDQSTN